MEADASGAVVECAGGERLRLAQKVDAPPGATLWLAVRPEQIKLTNEAAPSSENAFAGAVTEIAYLGDTSVFKVKLDNGLVLRATAANRTRAAGQPIQRGDRVWLSWPDDAAVVLTQ